jgi:hypothetical protein
MNTISKWVMAVGLLGGPLTAQATSVFQGQDANGAFDNSCTVSGATACAMFYDSDLKIEILNNWNIGSGSWSQAQTLAEKAGFNATGLTGWVLPTGNGYASAGASNQYLSIWNDVGGSLAGAQAHFDGWQTEANYWSGTEYSPGSYAWYFVSYNGNQPRDPEYYGLYAVAVRPGEISAVPLPATAWLLLSALGGLGLLMRRSQHQSHLGLAAI